MFGKYLVLIGSLIIILCYIYSDNLEKRWIDLKKTKVNLNPERQLVTAMIVSDRFLREISPVLRTQLLKTEYGREVASWVTEYWKNYKKAPGIDIQNIFLHKKRNLRNEELAENIAEFLTRLSADWEGSQVHNIDFLLNSSVNYLKMRSLEMLKEELDDAISTGNVVQGEQFVANFTRIAPPLGEGINLLQDPAKVASAFFDEEEHLFKFPGALGEIAGDFHRGDFMAYLGPMKRGKTQHLWYLTETAAYYGLKVAFFSLEMTEKRMTRRAWQSLVGSPKKDCNVTIPYFEKDNDGKWFVKERIEHRKKVNLANIGDIQKIFRKRFRTGGIKLICYPAYSATMEDINAAIDNMIYYDNFIPDVVVIDYLDIVAVSRGFRGEYRHQIDDIWKKARRMAQEWNVLVATVSQADKSTFFTDVTELSVAEDIRKLAHVTHMLGLSQTKKESEKGIMRVGQVAVRDSKRMFEQALVLYSFDIGRAVLNSRLTSEVDLGEDMEDDDGEEEKETARKRERFSKTKKKNKRGKYR